jgi:hypothetical protein
MEADPRIDPMPRAIGDTDYPVEAFNPLLRSLLGWQLVERVEREDGSHFWELTALAQRRLDALTPPRRNATTTLAYLDHWCGRCRQQRLTHLVEGRYLCEPCQRLEATGLADDQPVKRHAKPWPHRHREG